MIHPRLAVGFAFVASVFPASNAPAAVPVPLAFEVTDTADIHPGPISARVYVMLGDPDGGSDPRFGPDWFHPRPFFAVEARDWRPGEPSRIGPGALGFPGPLDTPCRAGTTATCSTTTSPPGSTARSGPPSPDISRGPIGNPSQRSPG